MNTNIYTSDNIVHNRFRRSPLTFRFSRLVAALKAWNCRRIAIRELSAMPDSLLRDIGIERYQIREAVNGCGAQPEVLRLRDKNIAAAPTVQKAA